MRLNENDLRELLKLVEMTADEEIDCSEFVGLVSGYIERIAADGAPPAGYEKVVHHLKVCPECREECEALLRAIREEDRR